jgi:glycosyltransferase involved in cell wall biosynthesis
MAARPLRFLWKRADRPPIEWWTGEVDVVWGPNFVVPPTRRAARVVSVHDLTPVRFPELCTRDTLDYPILIRRAVAAGALVQTDSEAVAAEVRDWLDLPSERVVAVPLGVTPVAGGDPGRGRHLAGHDRYVLALGTVEPRKDLPTLVRAFDRAAADRADLALVVAGPDGWGTAAFEAAVAGSAHAGRVRRLGWVDDDARADLLAGATCLAYPSLYEGFGLPPLEAMAAGVPVVTTDLAVLLEVTGDAAEHVPVADADALAEALVRLVDDEDRRADLRRRGRARAARYSWDRCAEGIADLLRRAADR